MISACSVVCFLAACKTANSAGNTANGAASPQDASNEKQGATHGVGVGLLQKGTTYVSGRHERESHRTWGTHQATGANFVNQSGSDAESNKHSDASLVNSLAGVFATSIQSQPRPQAPAMSSNDDHSGKRRFVSWILGLILGFTFGKVLITEGYQFCGALFIGILVLAIAFAFCSWGVVCIIGGLLMGSSMAWGVRRLCGPKMFF